MMDLLSDGFRGTHLQEDKASLTQRASPRRQVLDEIRGPGS